MYQILPLEVLAGHHRRRRRHAVRAAERVRRGPGACSCRATTARRWTRLRSSACSACSRRRRSHPRPRTSRRTGWCCASPTPHAADRGARRHQQGHHGRLPRRADERAAHAAVDARGRAEADEPRPRSARRRALRVRGRRRRRAGAGSASAWSAMRARTLRDKRIPYGAVTSKQRRGARRAAQRVGPAGRDGCA